MPVNIIDHNFVLQSYLPPKILMMSPEWVKLGIEQYFNQPTIRKFLQYIQDELLPTEDAPKTRRSKQPQTVLGPTNNQEAMMPTPESLARSIGFANFNSMKKAMEEASYPEPSRYYLFVACSIIADMLTRAGLTSKLDAKFTRFIMSAYLSINERVEQLTELNNRVHITWGAAPTRHLVDDPTPLIDITPDSDPFNVELDKLERALPATMQLPIYKDPVLMQAHTDNAIHEQEMDRQLIELLGLEAHPCQ